MTLPAIAPPSNPPAFPLMFRRLGALVLRHLYLHLGSWPRIVETLYWPMINISMWGFTSLYLVNHFSDATVVANVLIAGALLTEIFIRISVTILMLFLEEVWSRNLGHLFASPLRIGEYVGGLAIVCFLRTLISMTPAILVAAWLFHFSLFSLGWPLLAFIALLALNACWCGMLIVSLLLRYGLAAEWLGWMAAWLMVPLMAAYYPVTILPQPLQMIAHALPASHVFASMKSLMADTGLQGENLWVALGLNAIYVPIAGLVFNRAYQSARRRGGLLQMGE